MNRTALKFYTNQLLVGELELTVTDSTLWLQGQIFLGKDKTLF